MLFFYMAKRLFFSFLSLLVILTGALWLTQSLRFIEMIVQYDISIGDYFSLVVYLLPDLLTLIIPICLSIAALWTYYKFIVEHEFLAMQSVGMSIAQISKPLITLASLCFISMYGLNIGVIPYSFQCFRTFEHRIKTHLNQIVLKEGVFLSLKGNTLFVDEIQQDGRHSLIFINTCKEGEEPVTFLAQDAFFDQEKKLLLLKKGCRFSNNHENTDVLSFEQLVYDLTPFFQKTEERSTRIYEKPIKELLFPLDIWDEKEQRRHRVEGHQRLLSPFFPFLDTLIIIRFFLTQASTRRRFQRYRFILTCTPIFLFHMGFFLCLNLCNQHPISSGILYIPFFTSLFYLGVSKKTWRFS